MAELHSPAEWIEQFQGIRGFEESLPSDQRGMPQVRVALDLLLHSSQELWQYVARIESGKS